MRARQEPTFSSGLPSLACTDGEAAARLAAAFFGEPLEWQRFILDVLLARDERDKYAASAVGVSVPRQNGKSWVIRARCFYGLITSGERILFTCQHGDTADEMFKDLADAFEDEENVELHALLRAVRKTNGQQAIYLKNGGFIRFTTRTNSLARGKTYDALIYDEAQELTVSQQSASLPTISAGPLKNPQTIYLGTPPDPTCVGTVFRDMHDRVHAGESKVAWMEWGADEIGDPHDEARWFETNPSLVERIPISTVSDEADSMPPDAFARERLGWWQTRAAAVETVISEKDWDACARKGGDHADGLTCAAVKFAPDGSLAALATCVKPAEGAPFVRVIDVKALHDATQPFAEWLAARKDDIAAVALDGRHGVAAIKARLHALGMPPRAVVEVSARDAVAANSMFCDAVTGGDVAHGAQPSLDDAATKTAKRKIGADGFGFESTEDGDAALIEAAALAYWQAMTTKRNPKRKMRVL